jgi:histidine ammonia-lyase
MLAAAQGVDLRKPLATSPALQAVMAQIRSRAPFLDRDRLMAPDIAAVRALVESGWFRGVVGLDLPSADMPAGDPR